MALDYALYAESRTDAREAALVLFPLCGLPLAGTPEASANGLSAWVAAPSTRDAELVEELWQVRPTLEAHFRISGATKIERRLEAEHALMKAWMLYALEHSAAVALLFNGESLMLHRTTDALRLWSTWGWQGIDVPPGWSGEVELIPGPAPVC